ncbi:MAG TPA: hypothetical protein VFJ51_08470 [Nitrososphaeraceae archaeon]|nr:hypothetical protein [Nitrososphaeraceae archaeon]
MLVATISAVIPGTSKACADPAHNIAQVIDLEDDNKSTDKQNRMM